MSDSPTDPPTESGRRILIIDDDEKLCRLLRDYLNPLGYSVEAAHTGPEGISMATSSQWHAIILDFMLPGCDGLEVLKKIRAVSEVPILMFTARGEETDRIVGLEVGADDYLPKTFSTRELLARLRAVTRRSVQAKPAELAPQEVSVGPLRLIPDTRMGFLGDLPMALTPVEYDLLEALARSHGRIRTREQLLDEIRERNYEAFDRSIDVHISSLRKKLGDDAKNPRWIHTSRSAGYMLRYSP